MITKKIKTELLIKKDLDPKVQKTLEELQEKINLACQESIDLHTKNLMKI